MSKADLPNLNIATKKLQKKFKHAIDFGIEGNFNKANAKLFQEAIINHVDSATDIYKSTYRGQDVYVHMKDGLGVYTDLSGEFISGWKFTQEQINFHIKNGIRIK